MGVVRAILWPNPGGEQPAEIGDVDATRAQEHALLTMLLADAATPSRIVAASSLERADSADFYRSVGTAGRLFMEIETNAFALAA